MSNDNLGWDDEITPDEGEFITLPVGEYPFRILTVENARHGGSDKIDPCTKAIVNVEIDGGELGKMKRKENFFLVSKFPHGKKIVDIHVAVGFHTDSNSKSCRMKWGEMSGATGRLKLTQNPSKKDPNKIFNNVDKFLPPVETTQVSGDQGAF